LNACQTSDLDWQCKIEFKLETPHFKETQPHVHEAFVRTGRSKFQYAFEATCRQFLNFSFQIEHHPADRNGLTSRNQVNIIYQPRYSPSRARFTLQCTDICEFLSALLKASESIQKRFSTSFAQATAAECETHSIAPGRIVQTIQSSEIESNANNSTLHVLYFLMNKC